MPSRYKMPEQKVLLTGIFLYLILSMLEKTLTLRRTLTYVCTRDLSSHVKDSILIHPVSYGSSEAPVPHDWFILRKSSFPFSLIPLFVIIYKSCVSLGGLCISLQVQEFLSKTTNAAHSSPHIHKYQPQFLIT